MPAWLANRSRDPGTQTRRHSETLNDNLGQRRGVVRRRAFDPKLGGERRTWLARSVHLRPVVPHGQVAVVDCGAAVLVRGETLGSYRVGDAVEFTVDGEGKAYLIPTRG